MTGDPIVAQGAGSPGGDGVARDLLDVPTVASLMTSRLISVDAGATLREAQDILVREQIHHLLIVYGDRVVGLLSDRDVLKQVSPFAGTLSERDRDARTLLRRVFQFATYELTTVRHDAPVVEAAATMLKHDISCLPVVDDEGVIIGVITTRDLLRGTLACLLPVAA